MWPDRVSNPVPLALESEALPTELRGLAYLIVNEEMITSLRYLDT